MSPKSQTIMPNLCDDVMLHLLTFIPNESALLFNCQLVCKLFKVNLQTRIKEKLWKKVEEIVGKEKCEGLRNNTLKDLYITAPDKRFVSVDVKCLAAMLKENTSVIKLGFDQRQKFDYNGAIQIAEILKMGSTLQELDLGSCQIGDDATLRICEVLKWNKTLKTLILTGSYWYIGAKYVAEMLKVNSCLEYLLLNENGIDDNEATLIASALKYNSTLKDLCLCVNNIGIKGMQSLARALKVNKSLENLDLGGQNDNSIVGNKGIEAFARTLKVNSTLKELNFWCSNISDAGVKAMALALKGNTSLEKLSLRYNNTGIKGAKALAQTLKVNNTLQEIDLYDNLIQNEGALAIGESLKINNTFKKIILGEEGNCDEKNINYISEHVKTYLINECQREGLVINLDW